MVGEAPPRSEGLLLGGRLRPAGVATSFLRAPFADVVEHLRNWRASLGQTLIEQPVAFSEVVEALEPFEAPWTREVLFDCGQWTAYLNNERYGGDPTSAAPYLATSMGIECFVALHAPRYPPGHEQTSLEVFGTTGEPPLMVVRSVVAHAEDGRWSWYLHGLQQPFERVERYSERMIRKRFDRALLLEYLRAVGIDADEEGFYGQGALIVETVGYDRIQLSAQEVRDELGW